ncbi:MAG: phosphatidylglycerophosphatase A, partial [Sedimentisphaerales bacterium]|nr:phosphatidylglycerophosphatase A [Sedimentisphaerales bacterium]
RGVVGAIMVVAAVHGFAVTVLYGDKFIEQYGKDPSQIVSDEQCGQAVAYLGYFWLAGEVAGVKGIVGFALVGFVLFRLFDIVKPPPVRQLEKIRGAWGVLLDDVMAGIYALTVMQILFSVGWLEFLGQ